MGTHTQALLDVLATTAALLRREARWDSNHHMIGSLSLIREDIEKRAPTRVVTLGEIAIPHHPGHVQVLDTNTAIPLGIVLGGLEMEITSLATDLEMFTGHLALGFAAAVAALRAAAGGALRVRKALLAFAVLSGIFHHAAVRIGQEHLQPHVQANSRVGALHPLRMDDALLVLGFRLTHDQRVPMIVSAQHQVSRYRHADQRAMELDLSSRPNFAGTCRCFPSSSSQTSRLTAYWRNCMLCQRLAVLKRGNPAGRPRSFI